MALSITKLYHYAECRILFVVMLNIIMLSVLTLIVVMLSVTLQSVITLIVVMLSVICNNAEFHYAECRGAMINALAK